MYLFGSCDVLHIFVQPEADQQDLLVALAIDEELQSAEQHEPVKHNLIKRTRQRAPPVAIAKVSFSQFPLASTVTIRHPSAHRGGQIKHQYSRL